MNNFTVLLVDKPTDAELLERLCQRLQTAFKLSEEQARALANKPAGPLLKATTEARAKQVAQLYSSMGIEVRIVDLTSEAAPAPVVSARQVVSARPVVKVSEPAPEAPKAPPSETSPAKANDAAGSSAAPNTAPNTAPNAEAGTGGTGGAVITGRRTVAQATPPSPTPTPASEMDATSSPSISVRPRATVARSEPGAQNPNEGQANPRGMVVSNPSININTTPQNMSSNPTATATTSSADGANADGSSDVTEMSAGASSASSRRTSLRTRVVLTTLLPLLVLSAAVVAFIGFSLPSTLKTLIVEGARQLATSLGNSVNLEDLGNLNNQLKSLTNQPTVGFISIKSGVVDQSQAKSSIGDRLNFTVTNAINAYFSDNPDNSVLEWSDNLAGYAFLKAQDTLKNKGSLPDNLIQRYSELETAAKANAADGKQNDYEIVRVGVYVDGDRRTFGKPDPQKATFLVTVAVIANESNAIVRQQLWTLVAFALVILVISALIAVATARRIAGPILQLVEAADQISLGKLDDPVVATTNDEIGDLARALERMRSSLGAALERLRKRRR
jgi:HAMP domain-containing protein